jgi:hypothetical protein
LLFDKNIFALPKYPSQGEKAVTIDAGDKAKERDRQDALLIKDSLKGF